MFVLSVFFSAQSSKTSVTTRHTILILVKEESVWWNRLLKAEGKPPAYVKVDWSKYVDEDEESEAPDPCELQSPKP